MKQVVLTGYPFKALGASATEHRRMIITSETSACPLLPSSPFSIHTLLTEDLKPHTDCTSYKRRRKNAQIQRMEICRYCVNYSWMSPCSSNFCFLLCILGTAAGLVSTLSLLLVAWATIGLCVLNNYP